MQPGDLGPKMYVDVSCRWPVDVIQSAFATAHDGIYVHSHPLNSVALMLRERRSYRPTMMGR